jgi:sigma-B regulation protein RsbU (phosphoserine phosphatase)
MDSTPHLPKKETDLSAGSPLDQAFGTKSGVTNKRVRSVVGRQLFEYVLDQPSAAKAVTGRLLIVDHDKLSRDILARQLKKEGYQVEVEEDGGRAMARLEENLFDMVLWEVNLPGLQGADLLARLKRHDALQHLPVVLLSEQKDTETVVRCIEAGADDYVPKPFNPALLKARIHACMERKNLRDQERRLLATIQAQQQRLSEELVEATAYLRSLLPDPRTEPFVVDWRFIPCSELGGDAFGYHWIDDDHFALYLLDVCGHGVGAALLSVTVLNVLRGGTFHGVDFRKPDEVLAAANRAFPMEEQNNRYFTMWYGVYQPSTRTITYGSGGHPPALLFPPGQREGQKLAARGMMVGGMPGSRYPAQTCEIAPGSRLFLFCDGAYEITMEDGQVYTLDKFTRLLGKLPTDITIDLDHVVEKIRSLRGSHPLEDDLSIVAIQF